MIVNLQGVPTDKENLKIIYSFWVLRETTKQHRYTHELDDWFYF